MKNIIRKSLFVSTASIFSVLALASCEEWTDTESLPIVTPSVDEQLKADYMANLKAYKSRDHKVTFVTLDNKEMPANQSEHLMTLPDSVDFITLLNPSKVSPVIAQEISSVREKGTKVIYNVDFVAMEKEWAQKVKEDLTGTLTEEDALEYLGGRVNEELAYCDTWGFDGLNFVYSGVLLESLQPEQQEQHIARQNVLFQAVTAWQEAHVNHVLCFNGQPQMLTEQNKALLEKCKYIILPTLMVNNADELTVKALAAVMSGNVPSDRFVVSAMTTRPDDDKKVFGYFGTLDKDGNKLQAIPGCAEWVARLSTDFTRAGLLICDSENDYFNNTLVYSHIREAISIMNPHF